MAGVVNKVYCNVVVLRIALHVRGPGFQYPGNFCLWNPESRKFLEWNLKYSSRNPESHLFIPLLYSRSVDHLNQVQVVQHWRLFHSKVVWDKCIKSVGRIKNGIRASTI